MTRLPSDTLHMARITGAAIVIASLLSSCVLSAAPIGDAAVERMLSDAEQRARAGQFSDALTGLQRVLQIAPDSSEAWQWAGLCYLALGDRANAIEAYATHLRLDPESELGWAAMNRLFFDFEGQRLPETLDPKTITEIPVTMDSGEVLTPGPGGVEPASRRYAFTTSVVYPPPAAYPQEQQVPSTGEPGGVNRAIVTDPRRLGLYNRVSYGYVLSPDTGRLEMKLALHYPSSALAPDGPDAAVVATAAMANLLRLWWLSADVLGRVPSAETGPLNVWLTTEGEAGGEQWQDNVFLYGLGQPREPSEWLREIAHEWGHLLIPGIDSFDAPEAWASGAMGETLLLKWLARSAQATGDGGVQALWPGEVGLDAYFANRNDVLLTSFLTEGPNSALLIDRGAKGMDYLVGLVLFTEAAHGADLTRRVFDSLTGDQPPDLVRSYKDMVRALAAQGVPFSPLVGLPAPGASCAARALGGAEDLALQPGQQVNYWVYLPDGKWTMRVTASSEKESVVAASAEGGPEGSAILGAGEHVTGDVQLGELADGWKRVTVTVANAEAPVVLEGFVFVGTDVGPSPFGAGEEPAPAPEEPAEGL